MMMTMDDSMHSSSSSSSSESEVSGPRATNDEDSCSSKIRASKKVSCWRAVVMVTLFCTAVLVVTVTPIMIAKDEQAAFRVEFLGIAKEIKDVSEFTAVQAFSVIETLSITFTAFVLSNSEEQWPLVSMPNFEKQAGEIGDIFRAESIFFAPLIKENEKKSWEDYSIANQGWIEEGLRLRGLPDVDPGLISDVIYGFAENRTARDVHIPGYYLPVWQIAHAPTNASVVNLDLLTRPSFEHTAHDVLETRASILSGVGDFSYLTEYSFVDQDDESAIDPQSYILQPVFESMESDAPIRGFIGAVFPWDTYFNNILRDKTSGVVVVVDDRCGKVFTLLLRGSGSTFLGPNDLHDPNYDDLEYTIEFAKFAGYTGSSHEVDGNFTSGDDELTSEELFADTLNSRCRFLLRVYPSTILEESFSTNKSVVYTIVVAAFLFVVLAILITYDCMVIRKQRSLIDTATRSGAIVSSLFPKAVQEKLMEEAGGGRKERGGLRRRSRAVSDKEEEESNATDLTTTRPLADLYLNTTIIFADIAGFTAWSSVREPAQVFVLLETLFSAFDECAKSRRIYKVETVGDCYVAATGIPNARNDHAVVMCRFARDILCRMHALKQQLELTLGPGTADLNLRIGINSGPVTAGVIRGAQARFQLFGDTINTTARVETTGQPGRIHLSSDTAALLMSAGKEHWIKKREELVTAKGKGAMQTYWLASTEERRNTGSVGDCEDSNSSFVAETENVADAKIERLVDWNVQSLLHILEEIVAQRKARGSTDSGAGDLVLPPTMKADSTSFLDEVQEIICLPEFDQLAGPQHNVNLSEVEIPEIVVEQLRDLVTAIATLYRHNPFHNFEHASHVTMSVIKLLSRIVAPSDLFQDSQEDGSAQTLHDHTYGITSDPLTQFACAYSAIIHDIDHPGVPNAQLVEENCRSAALYDNRSVAEQNSLQISWDLLMDSRYDVLRSYICADESELLRFRQLVVNIVMATDIVDRELKELRNARWDRAFNLDQSSFEEDPRQAVNRKATIVLEHIIQASDVSHTMQHWHVYRTWNERFFRECYAAYQQGRAATDPSLTWYKGELGFFDYYIIPLAEKLADCGVFGKSSDEYLNYAQKNRREWEIRGEEVVQEMVESIRKEEDVKITG